MACETPIPGHIGIYLALAACAYVAFAVVITTIDTSTPTVNLNERAVEVRNYDPGKSYVNLTAYNKTSYEFRCEAYGDPFPTVRFFLVRNYPRNRNTILQVYKDCEIRNSATYQICARMEGERLVATLKFSRLQDLPINENWGFNPTIYYMCYADNGKTSDFTLIIFSKPKPTDGATGFTYYGPSPNAREWVGKC